MTKLRKKPIRKEIVKINLVENNSKEIKKLVNRIDERTLKGVPAIMKGLVPNAINNKTTAFDIIHSCFNKMHTLTYNYINRKDIAYCKEYEEIFQNTYNKQMWKLMDKIEAIIYKYYNNVCFVDEANKEVIDMVTKDEKENFNIRINTKKVESELEKNDILFYYTMNVLLKISNSYLIRLKDDPREEIQELCKYFVYARINILRMLKIIREEYNSYIKIYGGKEL